MEVGELLPRLSILTAGSGGLFLLHFPGGRPRRTLSVILPCEARTFLTVIPFGNIPRDCPIQSSYYTKYQRKSQVANILTKKPTPNSSFLQIPYKFDKNSTILLHKKEICARIYVGGVWNVAKMCNY